MNLTEQLTQLREQLQKFTLQRDQAAVAVTELKGKIKKLEKIEEQAKEIMK